MASSSAQSFSSFPLIGCRALRNVGLCVLAFLMCLSPAKNVAAQTITASITGTVTDSSKALIPNAKVIATQTATGYTRTAIADEHGDFQLNQLPVGGYDLNISGPGFKTELVRNLVLQVDQTARQDVTLQAGGAGETVTVTAATPLVSSETSSVSQVIDQQKILDLPLNGRNANQLVFLVPGVVQTGTANNQGAIPYSVAGGRPTTNSVSLDGIDNNDDATTASLVQPSVDMVREFRVEINTYSAAFGRYAGGQVDVTSKSGTNKIHGSAFYFARNDALDATNWSRTPIAKSPLSRKQYGASLGGPIRHDKTFIFGLYEGLRLTTSATSAYTVPTAKEQTGDFSELLPAIQLVNPFTRLPIPGNIILPSQQSAIGAALIKLYPAPTLAGLANNYIGSPISTQRNDQYNARVDHQITAKALVWARYTYSFDKQTKGIISGGLPGFPGVQPQTFHNAATSYTQILTPNLLNELRVGFNRLSLRLGQPTLTPDATALGITGLDPLGYTIFRGIPVVSLTGLSQIGGFANSPQYRADNSIQILDNVSYSHRSHSMHAGLDFKFYQINQNVNGNVKGTFTFNGQYTSATGSTATGNAAADLLFGTPSSDIRTIIGNNTFYNYPRQHSYDAYVQDDWKIVPRLTLNLGLRYELDPPVAYVGGVGSGFNPLTGTIQLPSSVGAANDVTKAGTTFPIPIPVPITKYNGSTICNTTKTNFAPRIGFAFRPQDDARTVINGGYGIFYNVPFTNTSCGDPSELYRFTENFTGSLAPAIPTLTLSNPFPAASLAAAFTPTANIPNQRHIPYIQQFNFGIQRQLSSSMVVELSYVGSTGTHLSVPLNINQASLNTPLPNTSATLNQRRPFYSLGLLNTVTQNAYAASSSYNALLARVEKRLTYGLSFLASYTFQKSLDNSGGTLPQNSFNLSADHGLSTFDVRDRFVYSVNYELPFGHGRVLGGDWHGATEALLGGWAFAGIFSAQTGYALTPTVAGDNSLTGGNNDRANFIPGGIPGCTPAPLTYFNTCLFQTPVKGTFGTASRGSISGPSLQNLDFSFEKNFRFRETNRIQFRGELFNALNHPNFNAPSLAVTSASTFGTVSSAGPMRQIQLALRYDF